MLRHMLQPVLQTVRTLRASNGSIRLGRPEVYNPVTLDELRTLYEATPQGSLISLPRDDIGELLSALETPEAKVEHVGDLSLPDVAARVGRAVSTVRGWCNCSLIPGAYKLNGRSWRVPAHALEAFLADQTPGQEKPEKRGRGTDLSSWRKGPRV